MNKIGLTVLTACLAACGSPMPHEEQTDALQLEQRSSDEGVLHEVSLPGDVTVQVLGERLESPLEQVLISVAGPIGFPDPLTALRSAEGRLLTQLELFLGIAPPGTEPHPALYRSHEVEAAAMGRVRPQEVVHAALPADWAHSEKALSFDTCENEVVLKVNASDPLVWTRRNGTAYATAANLPEVFGAPQSALVCVGPGRGRAFLSSVELSRCREAFTQPTRIGFCNSGTSRQIYMRAISSENSGLARLDTPRIVAPGTGRFTETSFTRTPFFQAVVISPDSFAIGDLITGVGEPRFAR